MILVINFPQSKARLGGRGDGAPIWGPGYLINQQPARKSELARSAEARAAHHTQLLLQ
jgi:hypothetical protein